MVSGKGWTTLALCGVLSLTAIACRGRSDSAVEVPPADTELPTAVDPALPETVPGTAPGAAPTPAPRPAPPEPGVGGTGTALNPPQAGRLTAQQPGSQINLRSQPSTAAAARGYGIVGDPVQLLRQAQGNDGTWYYVKFNVSGAEGWIRGDFISTGAQAVPAAPQATAGSTCDGLMEAMTFVATYNASGFTQLSFTNLETRNTFSTALSRQGSNNQGQPLYRGTMSPPAGGSYPVELVDLSGGNPRSGSQVAVEYEGIEGTGTCR